MICQFKEEERNSYALRKALWFTIIVLIAIFALFAFLSSVSNNPSGVVRMILGKWQILFLIIAYLFGMTWFQNRNLAKSTAFEITPDYVGKIIQKDKLNIGNKFGAARNERRFGTKANQLIPIFDIKSISINDKRIKIRSKDYSFFNGNGEVLIPKEVEKYEDLQKLFRKLKKELRLA